MDLRCKQCGFITDEVFLQRYLVCRGCGKTAQQYMTEGSQKAVDDFLDSFDFYFENLDDSSH